MYRIQDQGAEQAEGREEIRGVSSSPFNIREEEGEEEEKDAGENRASLHDPPQSSIVLSFPLSLSHY